MFLISWFRFTDDADKKWDQPEDELQIPAHLLNLPIKFLKQL